MDVYLGQQQLKRKRRSSYFKVFFIILGITALGAGTIYTIIYSPIFQVDDYIIENNRRLPSETVLGFLKPLVLKGAISRLLGEDNFLIWPKGGLDVSGTPLLSASIEKNWLDRSIKVSIQERELFAIWCVQKDACYWLDQNGLAFEEAPETEGSLILKVYDSRQEALLGAKVLEDRFLGNLLMILSNLKKINLPVKKITFDRELQELRAETYDGPALLFSVRFNPQLSIESLDSLLKTLDLKKLSYIDLRVENRIYYKNR